MAAVAARISQQSCKFGDLGAAAAAATGSAAHPPHRQAQLSAARHRAQAQRAAHSTAAHKRQKNRADRTLVWTKPIHVSPIVTIMDAKSPSAASPSFIWVGGGGGEGRVRRGQGLNFRQHQGKGAAQGAARHGWRRRRLSGGQGPPVAAKQRRARRTVSLVASAKKPANLTPISAIMAGSTVPIAIWACISNASLHAAMLAESGSASGSATGSGSVSGSAIAFAARVCATGGTSGTSG